MQDKKDHIINHPEHYHINSSISKLQDSSYFTTFWLTDDCQSVILKSSNSLYSCHSELTFNLCWNHFKHTFVSFPFGFFSTNSTPTVNLTVFDIIVVFQVMVHSSPFLDNSDEENFCKTPIKTSEYWITFTSNKTKPVWQQHLCSGALTMNIF